MSRQKTKKEIEGERTRAQIIEAAIALFAERGYRATSVAMIAKACGISTATVFWHFRSKEGLLQAIFNQMMEDIQSMMAEKRPAEEGKAPSPVLSASEFDYFVEQSERMRMLLAVVLEADAVGGHLPGLLRTLMHSYRDLLAKQLHHGENALPEGEARDRATLFVATLAGIIVLRVADARIAEPGRLVEKASRYLLGLGPEE